MGEVFNRDDINVVAIVYMGDSHYMTIIDEWFDDYDEALDFFKEQDEQLEQMFEEFLEENNISIEDLDDTADFLYLTMENAAEEVMEEAAVHGMDIKEKKAEE